MKLLSRENLCVSYKPSTHLTDILVWLQTVSHIPDAKVGMAHKRSWPTAMPCTDSAAMVLLDSDIL